MMPQSPITYLNPKRRNAHPMTRRTWGLPSSCPCSPWSLQLGQTLDRCSSARPIKWTMRQSRPRKAKQLPRKESGSTVWATRIRLERRHLNSFSTRQRNSTQSRGEANKPWCVAFAVKQLGRSLICATTCVATLTWSPSDAIPVDEALPSQVIETVISRRIFALAKTRKNSTTELIKVRQINLNCQPFSVKSNFKEDFPLPQ